MEYKIDNKNGIRLAINLCFNDREDLDKDYVFDLISGEDDTYNTHNDFAGTFIGASDTLGITRRYMFDKYYNITKRSEYKILYEFDHIMGFTVFKLTKTPDSILFDKNSAIIEAMNNSNDPDMLEVINPLITSLLKSYRRKFSNKDLGIIIKSLCGFAVHIGSIIIKHLYDLDENPSQFYQYEYFVPAIYDCIVINRKETNKLISEYSDGLNLLMDTIPNQAKLSKLLNDILEQLLPLYLNGSKTEDKAITPLNNDVFIDISVLAETTSTAINLKGAINKNFKKDLELVTDIDVKIN